MDCLNKREAKRLWRKSIKDAWDNRCCFCGEPPIDDASLTIDHIKPRSKGGEDCTRNCTPCCLQHNQSKGSSEWREWYRAQPFYEEWREQRIDYWLRHGRLPDQAM
jgi:5-methylcytosine-specific restriction endonuclease McrA